MSMTLSRAFSALYCFAIFSATVPAQQPENSSLGQVLSFEKDIRPILRAHCLDCHGAHDELSGNLDLRQVRLMHKGGDSGPAIDLEKPLESVLLQKIESGEMPPGNTDLKPEELRTIRTWLEQKAPTLRPEPDQIPPGIGLTPEERSYWFFQPIIRPEPPVVAVDKQPRVANPIDAFLLAEMPAELSFAEEADRPTLIRRLYFDLTGLPPTVEQMDRWISEPSQDWYERLVEELLQSPHYGERWARHWLDVAGYADSDGFTVADAERPWAWKYRDYVIRSLNADKPINRFITEQLAGDELAGPIQGDMTAEQIELLTATGFLRNAADGTGSGANDDTGRNQVIADTIKIVSTSMLGMSMACAQCHDHRYDPIPQTDYFAMRAVFAPAFNYQQWKTPPERLISLYTAADRARAQEVAAEVEKIAADRSVKQSEYMKQALDIELMKYEPGLREQLRNAYETAADKRDEAQKMLLESYPSVNISPGVLYQYLPQAAEELKKIDAKIAEVQAQRPKEEFLSILTEPAAAPPETRLFHRGDFLQPKQVVMPAALTVATPEDRPVFFPVDDESVPTSGRRLAFAGWLTGRDNPLVSRVLVNRFWLHHFGRGIVATPGEFGVLGAKPTHPLLLDWLADEFMSNGWSLKHLHRVILTSSAWKQSTKRTPVHEQLDPDNRWYSRRSMVRLDAEILRDRLLTVNGKLDTTMFGPPIAVQEDETGQVIVDPGQTRRSLYIQSRRSRPVAMLQAFDAPVMETNCEMRPVSTVATQSLMLMNSETMFEKARTLMDRCASEPATLSPEQATAISVLPQPVSATWSYGYGRINEESQRVDQFTPFPKWTGSTWQGGEQVPDPGIGYAFLRADGGHPDSAERSVIRRWTAPKDGILTITGSLMHSSPNGDGVRGRIVSSSKGLTGSWDAFNGSVSTGVSQVEVTAGDTIDMVVDCRENITSDSFTWTVSLTFRVPEESDRVFSSATGFGGPVTSPSSLPGQIVRAWQLAYGRQPLPEEVRLSVDFLRDQVELIGLHGIRLPDGRDVYQEAMINLCHTLLTSNEFLYVD
ncbi:MAG: PSD1 domain-containing protein [Planctomyces sp.]|nr:PSD1 domain-containing protein [Planctomyces sp.]